MCHRYAVTPKKERIRRRSLDVIKFRSGLSLLCSPHDVTCILRSVTTRTRHSVFPRTRPVMLQISSFPVRSPCVRIVRGGSRWSQSRCSVHTVTAQRSSRRASKPTGPNAIGVNEHCARRIFLLQYQDRGRIPEIRRQVVAMAINGSGIRDTARVLRISPTTVIAVLKKSRRASPRHPRVTAPSLFTRRERPGRTRRRAR